jgi:hypothetical protein
MTDYEKKRREWWIARGKERGYSEAESLLLMEGQDQMDAEIIRDMELALKFYEEEKP